MYISMTSPFASPKLLFLVRAVPPTPSTTPCECAFMRAYMWVHTYIHACLCVCVCVWGCHLEDESRDIIWSVSDINIIMYYCVSFTFMLAFVHVLGCYLFFLFLPRRYTRLWLLWSMAAFPNSARSLSRNRYKSRHTLSEHWCATAHKWKPTMQNSFWHPRVLSWCTRSLPITLERLLTSVGTCPETWKVIS